MFLASMDARRRRLSFPHASGGVSIIEDLAKTVNVFSPREWGCFLLYVL